MTSQNVYVYMSRESAALLEELLTTAADEFYNEHDMNDRAHLEMWADIDRLKVDIAIARARAETR